MDDLVRWLSVQLDDDERIARAVEDRSAPWDGQWMADGNSAVRTFNGHVLFYRHDSGPLKPGLADHVAEWDPARVLREVEAKRRMITDVAASSASALDMEHGCCHEPPQILASECSQFAPTDLPLLRLLASAYEARPGFKEEWRP